MRIKNIFLPVVILTLCLRLDVYAQTRSTNDDTDLIKEINEELFSEDDANSGRDLDNEDEIDQEEFEQNVRLPKGEEPFSNSGSATEQNTDRYNDSTILLDDKLSTSENENVDEDSNSLKKDEKLTEEKSPPSESPTYKLIDCEHAEVVVLNKVTAQSTLLTLKKGECEYSGNIEIKLYRSLKQDDPYHPDNLILLKVVEKKLDDDPKVIFQGWLYSSSLSLSSLEHPVYEIIARRSF